MEDIAHLAQRLFAAPAVLITLRGDGVPSVAAASGLDAAALGEGLALCAGIAAGGQFPDDRSRPGLHFFAGAPLPDTQGGIAGAIVLADHAPREALASHDRAALDILAHLAGERLARVMQVVRLDRQAKVEALKAQLLTVTAEAADFATGIAVASDAIMAASGATSCFVFRLAPDKRHVLHVHSSGRGAIGQAAVALDLPLTIDNSQVGRTLASNQATLVPDIAALETDSHPALRGAQANGVVAMIVIPVDLPGDRYAFSLGLPACPEDGEWLTTMLAQALDVLRSMMRRLREQETTELFRRALELYPDAVIITTAEPIDPPGPRIVYVNAAFTRLTGYTREEVLGQTPRILQGADTSRAALASIRRALERWSPVQAEVLNYRKDGTPIWLDLHIAPVDDATGWYTHWVSVQRDISERRAAEKERAEAARELELLISAVPGVVQRVRPLADGSWRAVFSARSIEELTGFSPADYESGLHHAHFSAAQVSQVRAHMRAAWEHGQAVFEGSFAHRNGQRRVLNVAMRANRRADGIPEIIAIWTDVTAEREQAWQVAQANRLSTLGEMAAGIAHELNQPLTAIAMTGEVAMMKLDQTQPDVAGARERVERMTDIAHRAASIIKNLSEFAIDRHADNAPVSLAEAIARTRLLVERMIQVRGITLEFLLPDDLPLVRGDLVRIEQVLVNLLMNARDVLEERQVEAPRVVVTASADAAHVRLDVSDNGGGVPAEVLDRLFDPFFTTKGPDRGTGLGLSISRAAMNAMQGHISVRNGTHGAVFTLLFEPAA